jgi:alginate O-acetyltransferase complex protein AlgI
MSITSFHFFYFLLLVLAVYYALPRRLQNVWLLLVSYAFYVTWAWQFALILLGLTAVNFLLAQSFDKREKKPAKLLWLGIGLNAATLLLFRTADFYLPSLLSLLATLGLQLDDRSLQFFLPIGMAYYTLQNISYLLDVYRKQTAVATDFIDFALYLVYFPKLISGPIERARTFLPRLAQPRQVDNSLLARSFSLILIGLLRKLLIANGLSNLIFWDAFETPAKYTGPELIFWLMLYGLFLYNDFAGYTSLARGVSGLFGIELSPNFQQPYFARNLAEFWNSWHITLSHWLRDYIFFPLSRALLRRHRSRGNLLNLILPPMVTMLLSGLWHGSGWHMLLWGGLHGFYQVLERLSSLRGVVTPPQQRPLWRQLIAMIKVFFLVTLAWVPFIMEVPVALAYWRGMLDWTYPVIRFRRILLFAPFLILTLSLDWLQRRYQDELFFLRWPRPVQATLLAVSLFLILLLLQSDQEEPFVYQGF